MSSEKKPAARNEGHHLLHGVAGSGKTVVLICRARHLLARHPNWRILVVCYNRVLADYLRGVIGAHERLEVLHFHRWCWRRLEAAGVPIPEPPAPGERSDYWDRDIPDPSPPPLAEERTRFSPSRRRSQRG